MDFKGHICTSIQDYKDKIELINFLLKDFEEFTSDSFAEIEPQIFTTDDFPIILTSNNNEINAEIEKNGIIFTTYNTSLIKVNEINCYEN